MNVSPGSVRTRFGLLVDPNFGIFFPALRRHAATLGLSPGQQMLIEQLLSYYREAGDWRSVAQATLARDLGRPRQMVQRDLTHIRNLGLVAVRRDARFPRRAEGPRASTLYYCADPYLAALGYVAAHYENDMKRAAQLVREARGRLKSFVLAAARGEWSWRVGAATSENGLSAEELKALFIAHHRLEERVFYLMTA